MHLTRAKCCAFLALILTLSLSSVVCSDTSGPFTTTTPVAYTRTDWARTLAFPKFNSALGTLTQVDILIPSAMRTTLTVTNSASSTSTGSAQTEVKVTVSEPSLGMLAQPDYYSPEFAFELDPGESVISGQLVKTGMDMQSYTTPSVLSAFTGPGTITFDAGTYTKTWIGYNGGNTEATQVTDASCTGQVTYWYEVPEPSGLMVLVPGLLGLVTMIKRRR
jgi:hypothetical protein